MDDWYRLYGFNQPMSSMSHLVGAIVFLVMAVLMIRSAQRERARFWFCGVFAVSAVLLLSLSGVYHMFEPGFTPSLVLLRLDVAAIFVLIAGTFTPIHGILFRGWKRWGVLIPLWVIAVCGVTLRTVFFDSLPYAWGTAIFLAMGWIGLLSTFLVLRDYGRPPTIPLIAGGILYTLGAIGDGIQWPTIIPMVWSSHETFHMMILAALGCHWSLISQLAEGRLSRASRIIRTDE
jgi:channel protein (hemolysin III family)